MYCTCHARASRGHGRDYPRRSSFRRMLCVLRLPYKNQPRPSQRLSPSEWSVYSTCHTTASRGHTSGGSVYCACHTRTSRGHGGDYLLQKGLYTPPATQEPAAATAATIRAAAPSCKRLCILHLPRKSQPRPRQGLSAPQLLQEALCTAPTPRPWRRLSAPQLLQEGLCTAPATQEPAAAMAATISFRKVCILHLPHKSQPRPWWRLSALQLLQEALCTAPATQKPAAATAATIRAAAPSGGSVYCACQATCL